jgi:hypothetical protein
MIDTIAMIGSPASRGAVVASVVDAGRDCLAAASAVSAASAAIAASVTMPAPPPTPRRHGGLRRHESICHAMSRLKCLSALASIKAGDQLN